MGCLVGAGLAIFEGTGDIFAMLIEGSLDAGLGTLIIIGILSLYYFLEVVWCIITVGAFCKVQALREKESGAKPPCLIDNSLSWLLCLCFRHHIVAVCPASHSEWD